jgi:hypothetical protein
MGTGSLTENFVSTQIAALLKNGAFIFDDICTQRANRFSI